VHYTQIPEGDILVLLLSQQALTDMPQPEPGVAAPDHSAPERLTLDVPHTDIRAVHEKAVLLISTKSWSPATLFAPQQLTMNRLADRMCATS
jgi:hypothetical protein